MLEQWKVDEMDIYLPKGWTTEETGKLFIIAFRSGYTARLYFLSPHSYV